MNANHSSASKVAAILVSPVPADHRFFQAYFDSRQWRLFHGWSLEQGLNVMNHISAPLVITDEHLLDGDWEELVEAESAASRQFLLLSDELNHRHLRQSESKLPFDVLARPLTPHKVSRALALARLDWQLRTHLGWQLQWKRQPSGQKLDESLGLQSDASNRRAG